MSANAVTSLTNVYESKTMGLAVAAVTRVAVPQAKGRPRAGHPFGAFVPAALARSNEPLSKRGSLIGRYARHVALMLRGCTTKVNTPGQQRATTGNNPNYVA